jgi:hypothetical protein
LLVYLKRGPARWLVLSGVLAGLATLTKAPAFSLVPFSLGALGLVGLLRLPRDAGKGKTSRRRLRLLGRALVAWLLWAVVLVTVFVLIWPVMWVAPQRGLRKIYKGVALHSANPHDSETFFLGEVVKDPGPAFYPLVWLFECTAVTLLFGVLGAVLVMLRKRWRQRYGLWLVLLALYAVLFLAGMSLSPKKINRYALPALATTDILAAAGLVAWADLLLPSLQRRRWRSALIALPLLAQALIVLPRHPDYGTHFNWLAGGPPTAAAKFPLQDEGEGLDLAAAFLNEQPGASESTAATQLETVLTQHFSGKTMPISAQPVDYVLFDRNDLVRQRRTFIWGTLWEQYASRAPEHTVAFDDIPHVWVYKGLPLELSASQIQHPQAVQLGGHIHLLGYDLRASSLYPEETLDFQLYWRADAPVGDDYTIFAHLLDDQGELLAQVDGPPAEGGRPTSTWQPGELILDRRHIPLPSDTAPGEYTLSVGMYMLGTMERLTVYRDEEGRQPEDQLSLASVQVIQPTINMVTPLVRLVALLIIGAPVAVCFLRRARA